MRAVVFDFDGVLVNSEPLHYRALHDTLEAEGIVIDEEEYLSRYLAYDDRGSIRIALEVHGQPGDLARLDRLARAKAGRFEALMRDIGFFPGAPELVRALRAEVPLAIASGARRAEIEAVLSLGGLRECFAAVVGADDVRQTKPHPEPYLTAATRLTEVSPGLQPEHCLAIEDSGPGIASARAAGMKVLAVTNSYPAPKLSAAHRVVGSLEAVGPRDLRELFD